MYGNVKKSIVLLSVSLCGLGSLAFSAGDLDSLYRIPSGVETKWITAENWKGEKGAGGKVNAGRKGSAAFQLKAGQTKVLADVNGKSGIIRRIWMTIDKRTPETLRGIKIEMFWDGQSKPAVSAPIGDFFGHSIGKMATFDSALFSSPEGRSFNCCAPMPFKKGMKVVITNESKEDVVTFFEIDCTIGDKLKRDVLYFHAFYRRQNPTELQKDYEFLPKVEGKGRYLGVNFGVIGDKEKYGETWWGEGEVKMYVDGDTDYPTLCGTGTEDYIGTGWGQERYDNLYQGCHYADFDNMMYSFYRLHVPDPVYFRKDIRATIQQIGWFGPHHKKYIIDKGTAIYYTQEGLKEIDLKTLEDDWGIFERQDDWSSCAYFYLDKPVNNLPPIDPVEKRMIKQAQ